MVARICSEPGVIVKGTWHPHRWLRMRDNAGLSGGALTCMGWLCDVAALPGLACLAPCSLMLLTSSALPSGPAWLE